MQYFRVNSKIYRELNTPKAILIMAYLTSYNQKVIEVEQTHLARICGYEGQMPQRYIKPTIDELVREGWIEGYEKVQAKNGYKSVTTRWHLTEKALTLSPNTQNNNKEKEQENKENKQTTQIKREQGDAPKAIPNCSNATKQPKPTNTAITSIDDIVAARREYEDKLKIKFLTQNGKLS